VRRDNGEKLGIQRENVTGEVGKQLDGISEGLKARAWKELDEKIAEAGSVGGLKEIIAKKGGIVRIRWCGKEGCAKEVEEETGATILGILKENKEGRCPVCAKNAASILQVGRSY
jgi:prolyl-tRNA synthetase